MVTLEGSNSPVVNVLSQIFIGNASPMSFRSQHEFCNAIFEPHFTFYLLAVLAPSQQSLLSSVASSQAQLLQ